LAIGNPWLIKRLTRASCIFKRKSLAEKQIIEAGKSSALHNVPVNVSEKFTQNLHLQHGHPLCSIKSLIQNYFRNEWGSLRGVGVQTFDDLSPIVSTYKAFDELLFPSDHPGRSPSDTYYVNPETVLRPHTSAHQLELIRSGAHSFLCSGDVYRRDEIDATHYPIFHQMEGLHIFGEEILKSKGNSVNEFVVEDMKLAVEGMIEKLFGKVQFRWNSDYFPFTEPSFELEILFQGKWLEVLGSGIIHQTLMNNVGLGHLKGWAFGLGLERLAMILYEIPDIRLFWCTDPRFLEQFSHEKNN